MPYGILKADTLTYYTASGDISIPVSGIAATVSGTISVPSGTAAAPSISYVGDPDTGFYSPGANQVAIATSGTGRVFVDASGNLGVGTASPSALVHAEGGVFVSRRYGSFGGGLEMYQADGTASSPAASSANRQTGALAGLGYDGSAYRTTSRIRLFSSDAVTSTSAPGHITFDTVASGTTAVTERLRITSDGKVGVGTTSPGARLEVAGSIRAKEGSGHLNIAHDGTNGSISNTAGQLLLYADGSNNIIAHTNGVERCRLDASGRLLVGTSSSRSIGGAERLVQIEGTTAATTGLSITRNSNDTIGANIYLTKSRGTSNGSTTIIQAEDSVGSLFFAALDGTQPLVAGGIQGMVDGTPGANDMPGRLVFSTTADGASSPTERMRISNSGVVTIKNGAVAEIGTLTDGATITPDFAANCNFTVTISGNRTMANPTNITAGQAGSVFIVQGSGSNTLGWGSYWDFPSGTAPTLSTASGAVDRVDYIVRTATSIHTVFTANYS